MIAPHNISSGQGRPRRGFTVVELLVVVTVIAILMAILVPTITGMFRTTGEFAMTNQQQQLDAAIESFKSDYGFYPSDFSEFVDAQGNPLGFTDTLPAPYNITVEQRLKQFLTKISPTHNEDSEDLVHAGETRLEHWWEEVGTKIAANSISSTNRSDRLRGPTVALWFWLSQLHNDAQYPFSGSRQGDTAPGNRIITSTRVVLFDFETNLFKVKLPDNVTDDFADYATEDGSGQYQLYHAIQAGGNAPLVYFHHQTYVDPTDTTVSTAININVLDPTPSNTPSFAKPIPNPPLTQNLSFYNPTKYQIIAAGYDDLFGDAAPNPSTQTPDGDYAVNDNICNFAEGRLDAFVDAQSNN